MPTTVYAVTIVDDDSIVQLSVASTLEGAKRQVNDCMAGTLDRPIHWQLIDEDDDSRWIPDNYWRVTAQIRRCEIDE